MNATVTELIIPKEKFEAAHKIWYSKKVIYNKKEKVIRARGLKAFCCVCHGISSPSYQVRYSSEGIVRSEVYCAIHFESVYHKTKDSTSEELAAKYNCQIGVPPPSYFDPWDKQNV